MTLFHYNMPPMPTGSEPPRPKPTWTICRTNKCAVPVFEVRLLFKFSDVCINVYFLFLFRIRDVETRLIQSIEHVAQSTI